MTTMDEKYGDGSNCLCCEECGLCIAHGDCKADGCGKEVKAKPKRFKKQADNGLMITYEIGFENNGRIFYREVNNRQNSGDISVKAYAMQLSEGEIQEASNED